MVVTKNCSFIFIWPGVTIHGLRASYTTHMQGQEEDIALIKMVLHGTPAAYGKLVVRYQGYVFSVVLKYVQNRELAEELAQDVFVKAYKSLADFKGNSKFSTWLYSITHNTCLSQLRKKDSDIVFPGDDYLLSAAEHSGQALQPGMLLEQKMQQRMLDQAMRFLPVADAEIITLFYLAEQSVDEIGTITGISASNVKVRLFRARAKLKEIMETKFSSEMSG